MIILDENIPESQRQILERRRIRCYQIGVNLGTKGLQDEAVPSLLVRARHPTFFTRDQGFYEPRVCHARYCVVCLVVGRDEVAAFVQRLLRHPHFDSHVKRLGTVVRVSSAGIRLWRLRQESELVVAWA
jgi:hypothetical protein